MCDRDERYVVPDDWGRDRLGEFADCARQNTIASFANQREQYDRLSNINDLYWQVVDDLGHSEHIVPDFLVLRAHSSLLGGFRMGLSGQLAEAYMCLRGCLESSLYALYISADQERAITWLNRHEDNESRCRVRREFTVANVMNHLESLSRVKKENAQLLYDRTIDYGAHPNERAALTQINMQQTDTRVNVDFGHFQCGNIQQRFCLKTAAQVGICSLDILYHVFPKRFGILSIDMRLDVLKRGL